MSNDTFHHFGGRRQEIQNWTLPFIENISFWTSAKCRHSENVGKCWYSKKMFSVDFASIWFQRTCWLRYVFFVFFCKIDFQIFSKELGHVNRFSKWLCALMTKVAEAAKCGRGCWLSRVCSIFNYLNQPYFVFLYWYLCICVFVHVYICIWGRVCWLSRVCLLNFQLPKPILPPRYSMER